MTHMRMSALLLLMVAGGLLLAGAAFAQTAVAVRPFTGIGPYSQLGKGLTNMLISDLFPLLEECGVKIVEWEHRADVIKEIELSQNPAFDPAHRLRKGLMIEPTVFADGVVTTTDTTVSWTIDLRDAETGRRIGGHKGSVPADEWLESEKKIAQSLARQLCRQGLDFSSPPVASQQPPPTDASAPAPAPASKGPDVHKQVDDVVNTLRNLKGLFGR